MYLWFIDIQHQGVWLFATIVVICFQNVSLIYWYSTFKTMSSPMTSCDLLSKCIFDLLIFNLRRCWRKRKCVVICFQNVSLIYWYSTSYIWRSSMSALWFAFKMYLWFIDIQRHDHDNRGHESCDLLSKCIFDLLIFNSFSIYSSDRSVVICFQNVSLIYWYSTKIFF